MNRKLIRPTLAEIKEKGRELPPQKEQANADTRGTTSVAAANTSHQQRPSGSSSAATGGGSNATVSASASSSSSNRSKRTPPSETYAEIFYYKKQMDAHTPMIIVLQDGEEIEGTIEWYDREALKVNRRTAPNILLLKHNIKYMFKAEDREAT